MLGTMFTMMRGYLFSFPSEYHLISFNCFRSSNCFARIAWTRVRCTETNSFSSVAKKASYYICNMNRIEQSISNLQKALKLLTIQTMIHDSTRTYEW